VDAPRLQGGSDAFGAVAPDHGPEDGAHETHEL